MTKPASARPSTTKARPKQGEQHMALAPLDSHLTQSAHDEMQGRIQTITNQIAARRKAHDELLRKAESEAAAITELTRLRNEYQNIVSVTKTRTFTGHMTVQGYIDPEAECDRNQTIAEITLDALSLGVTHG